MSSSARDEGELRTGCMDVWTVQLHRGLSLMLCYRVLKFLKQGNLHFYFAQGLTNYTKRDTKGESAIQAGILSLKPHVGFRGL